MSEHERDGNIELLMIASRLDLIHQELEIHNTWMHLISDNIAKLVPKPLKEIDIAFGADSTVK